MTALVETPVRSAGDVVARGRRRRAVRRAAVIAVMLALVVVLYVVSLVYGNTVYSLGEVWDVIRGETVPGASFTVGELRLPRATLAVLAGAAFGVGGVTFQTMLRNPLASPDFIGISSGASAAAVFAIITLEMTGTAVSLMAITAALATALVIYVLAFRDGVAGTRLILIGIAVAAMLDSVVSYLMLRAAVWDLQTVMRWLTGSLNNASWDQVRPLALALVVAGPVLLAQARGLTLMQQGDDSASALGIRVERTRLVAIVAAVTLIAFATAAAGPIAFVAFLSGPIAARIIGGGTSLMIPAALVGSLLVLTGDLLGQFAFENRYPVGVITGVLGAPYLVYLLIRTNRSGGSL
ncbi:FecCD family ABC transporter permease [Nocardioides lianchengensis]|uniref:Iron complex transport system permease protein n=1 Tax=Nocardioides lianchengensis TaxID=1045774 RepID=A0A1G7A150_9ACTN|nr:iron chelate uptake ABC transporter family permease subunit [Nocardioides lianchengensis]NYG12319.1 iron complex transport system permease protein [Nocardioides lianchengensis]SDE08668.1 iron complex transport system permease protein [Nocardioides lianchengensis]